MTNALTTFRNNLSKMDGEFKAALPEHISTDKFKRTALTAVQQNPALLDAEPKSVFSSLVQCATDGLLPNGKEAALVIYTTKSGKEWVKKAQYMPMVYGVRKRMHNSGDIETIDAQVVYENDDFDYQLGDEPKILHKPYLGGERGNLLLAYCIIKFKDGGVYRELMTRDEILKAKAVSKSKDEEGKPTGPWKDWESEMWRKTVLHRAAKSAPTSSEIEKFLQEDMARILSEKQERNESRDTTAQAMDDIINQSVDVEITAEQVESE